MSPMAAEPRPNPGVASGEATTEAPGVAAQEATAGETATRVSPAAATSSPPHGDPLVGEPEPGDGQDSPPAPSVPAGEPEAPTGPTAPPSSPAEPGHADEHEAKLAGDIQELAAKAQKADEYLELAQRTKADFENYRRRAAREASLARERGVAKLAKELLPAVDNLDRALDAAQAHGGDGEGSEPDSPLISGIKLVHAEVVAALGRAGIERFEPRGEQFDPQYHEAVAQQPFPGSEPGSIVEVYQRGYRIGETVLRPARVLVAA